MGVVGTSTFSRKLTQASVTLISTHALRVGSLQHDTETLDDRLRSFWDLESLDPDQSVYEEFGSTVRFNDGRYEVSLPWKDPHPILPDNYQLSLKRLQGLLCHLRQNPKVLQEYDSIIQNQLCQGIVEAVDDPESIAL